MLVILRALGIFLTILSIISFYLSYRYFKANKFIKLIVELYCRYIFRRLNEGNLYYKDPIWFLDKYSEKDLIFNIKPFKLKYWYTKEELEEINK